MAGPYDFHSPGFAAIGAIERELLLREQMKQQAMRDELLRQRQEQEAKQAQADLETIQQSIN